MPGEPTGDASARATPRRQLSVLHAASVCVGMVIGAGIFRSTPNAAASVGSSAQLLLAWAAGGGFALVGALCFAEMAAAFPDAGGDYFFLRKAYGPQLGFLFAWSRFAVIHTGSMAMLAFVFGDYLGQIVHVGTHDSELFAGLIIMALTGVNLTGIRAGLTTKIALMIIVLAGLLALGSAGAWLWWQGIEPPSAPVPHTAQVRIGTALIYLTVVAITSLTVMNAILIVGARTTYAAARDIGALPSLSRWHEARGTPPAAILAISGVSLLPLAFALGSAYTFYASLVYVKIGALVGVAVLALGALLLALRRAAGASAYRA